MMPPTPRGTKPTIWTRSHSIKGSFYDPVAVWQWFLEAINGIKGLTVLASQKHDFPYLGLTGIVILGESHAAIHTWPDDRTAWLQLATCGSPSQLDAFTAAVQACPFRDADEPSRESEG